MPRIQTRELLSRISEGDFTAIKLKGLQDGTFYLLLETAAGSFILENADGSMKQYPKVDYALTWLKRMTNAKEVVVDVEIWRADQR
jgi:hypothetical protein